MSDKLTKALRSELMSKIRAKNTHPELLVRSALFRLGFRFRIHSKKLPGSPDIVLPKYKAVIFIHGCFWHGHNCKSGKLPATNKEFWEPKIAKNQARDRLVLKELKEQGWKILTIWECSLKGSRKKPFDVLMREITNWLKRENDNKNLQAIGIE